MSDTQINLIKKDVGAMSQFSHLEDVLRKTALWFLGVLFIFGLSVSVVFFVFRSKVEQIEARKVELVREINAQSAKEGILLALKERIGIAGKALDAAKPWGKLFTIMGRINDPSSFSSISIDETGRVSTSLELVSVDDAVTTITNVMSLSRDRSLKSPQMLGFTFREDGNIQLSLSFFPIFSL